VRSSRPFIIQTPLWCYFGYGEGQHRDCDACEGEYLRTGRIPNPALDCWKVEFRLDRVRDPESVVAYLLELAAADRRFMGKYSMVPIDVPSVPGSSGESESSMERVAVVYFGSRREAEDFCLRAKAAFSEQFLPGEEEKAVRVRRGCWHFEVTNAPPDEQTE